MGLIDTMQQRGLDLLQAWLDPSAWEILRGKYLLSLGMEVSFYLFGTLVIWLGLHVFLKQRLMPRLIGQWPRPQDMRREITYSVSTLLVFSAISMGVFAMVAGQHMVIYARPEQYGWAWMILSLPLMLLWHDAYFYWSHRLLHSPWLFRRVHSVHHRSRHPSPWAAYSFHPIEALINSLYIPLALMLVPLHGGVLFALGLHQILRNAHGHGAVETMPAGFVRHWLFGHFTTTTHHHLHHETAQGNYGVWFTWWDRWCRTERADYLARFDATVGKPGG